MEDALVHDIKRLRILTPSDCDNMDGLVPDLSYALEESTCSRPSSGKNIKSERPWKRRFRSSSNLNYCSIGGTVKSSAVSDSESSSDDKLNIRFKVDCHISLPQTDSDNDVYRKRYHQKLPSWRRIANMVESDSVNENFHPAREHKRKKKFKRMVVDSQSSAHMKNDKLNVTKFLISIPKYSCCHKKFSNVEKLSSSSNDLENTKGHVIHSQEIYCGKRKRSLREKSIEYNINDRKVNMSSVSNSHDWSFNTQSMDCDNAGHYNYHCNITSSEDSDNGFMTNDEGREADDEHSDVSPTSAISLDLQHSFCCLSARGKVQSPVQNNEHLIMDFDTDFSKNNNNAVKKENMQAGSSSLRNIFRCEGTKRRRRTPPTTIYGKNSASTASFDF